MMWYDTELLQEHFL